MEIVIVLSVWIASILLTAYFFYGLGGRDTARQIRDALEALEASYNLSDDLS